MQTYVNVKVTLVHYSVCALVESSAGPVSVLQKLLGKRAIPQQMNATDVLRMYTKDVWDVKRELAQKCPCSISTPKYSSVQDIKVVGRYVITEESG